MRRVAELLSGVALCAACAAPAGAQDGAGLYEPFPEPAGPEVARDFIGALPQPGRRLAADLSGGQLERGARVPARELPRGFALPARAAAAPHDRAEPGAFFGSAPAWVGAAALLALAGVASVRLARR